MAALASLLVAVALIWFYAAARPRFGPGPRAAVLVAGIFWLGGPVTSLLHHRMIGLFNDWPLGMWAVTGLVEWVIAALVGGWIYREA